MNVFIIFEKCASICRTFSKPDVVPYWPYFRIRNTFRVRPENLTTDFAIMRYLMTTWTRRGGRWW